MIYQPGDRIALVRTTDPHTRLAPGAQGTVTGRDDRHGQIHIAWDDGSTLSMLPGEGDEIRLITAAGQQPGRQGSLPFPAPERGELTRYLAACSRWTAGGMSRGAQIWRHDSGETARIPAAGAYDDDAELPHLAAAAVARSSLGISPGGTGTAVRRLQAVLASHHQDPQNPALCQCGLPHPCPAFRAATGTQPSA